MEGLSPVGAGENHDSSTGTPSDLMAYLQQFPMEFTMEDLLRDESVAGHTPSDPHSSSVDTSNYSAAADAMEGNAAAAAGQGQPVLDAHTEWDWTEMINPDPTSTFTGAGTEDMMQSGSGNVLPAHTPSAAAVDGIAPVLNAGFTHPQPDNTSCCASTAAADMGSSSPLDLEVYAGAGLSQSGGGGAAALREAGVRGPSSKRRRPICGSSSQRSTPPEFNLVELLAGLVQSDPSSADIKPPTGSTDAEIIRFLRRERMSMPLRTEVNLSVGEQDGMAPKAVRSYVTSVEMRTDQKTNHGYWKEKQVKTLGDDESDPTLRLCFLGVKRTWQFHKYDDTKTNWFMEEYIPTGFWGIDLYMESLRFRVVYKGAETSVPGKPTSRTVKHRLRGPDDRVVKGESPVWQHFIKIYDRHPELEGSKVVYAVCCHCEGVLKAGTDNGTKSLLTHCDRTCPVIKNKNQQPRSSRE